MSLRDTVLRGKTTSYQGPGGGADRDADRQAGPRSSHRDDPWRVVYELAGVCGIDPGPLTLRELLWMADARGREGWAHTSAILALIANVNRDPRKTRPFKPSDFDPYSARDKREDAIEVKDMTVLRDVFNPKSERTP